MPKANRLRVAIVGGGPAGGTLAILLTRKGCDVALWDSGEKPELIVGESLIPAVVPILRKLGIESDVADLGVKKPGVSFVVDPKKCIRFSFSSVDGILPPYAYNVPRPGFDRLIMDRAARCGATLVKAKVAITHDPDSDRVGLSPDSLDAAGWSNQPDLVVDATGRRRLFARTLKLPQRTGPRKDVALFAHFANVSPLADDPPGQVTIARSSHGGWSWRIPLKAATSVGVVLPGDAARNFGKTPAEKLESAIASDEALAPFLSTAKRTSGVATYSNYQIVTGRGSGKNWVLLGDALGFVDPMLSPGLCLALRSADWLAEALPNRAGLPLAPALEAFVSRCHAEIEAWTELIGQFYGGQIFNLYFARHDSDDDDWNPLSKGVAAHISKHISCMCAGATTAHRYSRNLVRLAARHGANPAGAAAFAIV